MLIAPAIDENGLNYQSCLQSARVMLTLSGWIFSRFRPLMSDIERRLLGVEFASG